MTNTKPTLLLDETKCKENIRSMVSRAKLNKVDFRPHFKTHQSLEVGKWFKNQGVHKITVSSCEMATYFSSQFSDITIAFPVNILEIDTINKLAASVRLNILLESEESARFVAKHLKCAIGFFIKIDVGSHRTGLMAGQTKTIDQILAVSSACDLLTFRGFLSHAGHTYDCKTFDQVKNVYLENLHILSELRQTYIDQFPGLMLSTGDTPSSSLMEDFGEVDEIRPGNFVFYDLTQLAIGSASTDQIAIAMQCPVVAIHRDRCEMVLYGGGIHFSKEYLEDPIHGRIYGRLVNSNPDGTWGEIIQGAYLSRLSQEHGILHMPQESIGLYRVGDTVHILPVHACMTVSCMKKYKLVGKGVSSEKLLTTMD